jgi:sugar phosphate isomerase/epimerase
VLTYCLNVHPGESWPDNLATLRTTLLAVRDLVSPSAPFPLGLRLSAAAAATLDDPARLEELLAFLAAENLHVLTINAFPYGRFHGAPVKENVYAPDWRSPQRLAYTNQVATLLSALIPAGATGTISTVPCSWKPWIHSPADLNPILDNLTSSVAHCAQIAEKNGRNILLTLEPEPGCLLETTPETIAFFKDHLFTHGAALLAAKLNISADSARDLIRHHLGVCLDTCHAALQFEDPAESLRLYESQGIRVPKIQISSALRTDASPAALDALRPFDEPVYLHQVKARTPSGEILSWPDLPPALEALPHTAAQEVRVHFHVPLHFTKSGPLHSTASLLTPTFLSQISTNPQTHLEIETYTWHVLPKSLQSSSIEKSIAAEFAWFHQSIATND